MTNSNPQNSYYKSQIGESDPCNLLSVTQTKKQPKALSMISTRKGSNDSMDNKPKFKTQMCKYWLMKMVCPFQEVCCFAHGQGQIRNKKALPSKYKTRRCTKFDEEGYCKYGGRCQFIHHHIKQDIKYQDIIQRIRNGFSSLLEDIEEQIFRKRRRLSVFEKIIKQQQGFCQRIDGKGALAYEFKEQLNNPCKTRHNSI